MKKIISISFLFSFLFLACSKKDDTCEYDACANKAPDSEIQSLKTYLATNSITATQHCSGVFYRIDTEGSGKNANACSNISVKYKGTLTNGATFDQAVSPVNFNLGMLVAAWRNVLPLLKAGGHMIMYVPPSLGYGNQAVGTIPANSVLIFEVDMVSVQ